MKPSEILRDIKRGKYDAIYGICNSFLYHPESSGLLIGAMNRYNISFKNWPHFSGCYHYPIQSSINMPKGMRYYNSHEYAYEYLDKWSKRSKYGKLRWDLLDWLIEQFEAKGA